MNLISKKCQYAIRAVMELVNIGSNQPVKTAQIAGAQGVSPRFMEIILNNLKNGGFIDSRRGSDGGYLVTPQTKGTCVLEVIEYIDGPITVAKAVRENNDFFGKGTLDELWRSASYALRDVYRYKTFAQLCTEEKQARQGNFVNYVI